MLTRNRIFPIILIILVFIVWKIRQKSGKEERVDFNGQTMGTYYNVIYLHPQGVSFKQEVDSLLEIWNQSLSTYIKDSEISRFNRSNDLIFESPYFHPVLRRSHEIYKATGGAFDPTVMPLVNAWGFGPEDREMPDSLEVEELLKLVGFNYIGFDSIRIWKKKPGVQLDFSAIAKGYGVDVVGEFLHDKGIRNYLVDIGGEITCKGINDRGTPWITGIEDPQVQLTERKVMVVVEVSDKAIATSGNYRNFYVKNGKKFTHTISPFTGYPVQHSLLSATVVADDCMTADGFATAFMVLGADPSIKILDNHPELEAYFIFSDDQGEMKTFMTEGFKAILKEDV
jgi:thiamine biosynthesis lipoprotein